MTNAFHGSYRPEDVTFLLTQLSQVDDLPPLEKEHAIQSGKRHYSEFLKPERAPSSEYLATFRQALAQNGVRMAQDCRTLSELIARQHPNAILVSLARAGTPVGVILKHLLSEQLGRDVAHYSVSIIRDRGIDLNALNAILRQHPDGENDLIFIDGWTGKGVITQELERALTEYNAKYQRKILPRLYVLSDLAGVATGAASYEDYLIPSAILNATISGLVSRTVLNHQIQANDYHGCLYYRQFADIDQSQSFADHILQLAHEQTPQLPENSAQQKAQNHARMQTYLAATRERYAIKDNNLIKPGIGEATRVLLRRVPERLILRDATQPSVQHLKLLAEEKNIPITYDAALPFYAVSLIKTA
ncbi:cysteine protease StiP family protein [Suttonella ornithocola]|uniref:Citrate lyase beta subunit n=1 Tax=Suttonella ornithocola TaxID=279832 RepID=A0A380MQN2_9GAMM|nr:cysteine protease StiP family protein [Suttonella ornithocola]SUO94376.1 Citrate lyase beta subunit [Suttonella ornithocola]